MDLPYWITLGGKTSLHCAGGWGTLTVVMVLCCGVATSYSLIAGDWRRRQYTSGVSAKGVAALEDLRNIFIWCGITGYLMRGIVLALIPLWTPYILFLVYLNYRAWSYYFRSKGIDIVYRDVAIGEAIVKHPAYSDIKDAGELLIVLRRDLEELRLRREGA